MASKRDKLAKIAVGTPISIQDNRTAALQSILEGTRPEYKYLNPAIIRTNPNNDYRTGDTDADIAELASDIERNGLLHNLVVAYHEDKDEYVLLSGERRLRAVLLNQKRYPDDRRWQEIYVQVRKGLTPTQEVIILDAANLESRGSGAGGELRYRKAIKRFVDNIMAEYGLSEKEAEKMTATISGASGATISRNLEIENEMVPALKALLDEGVVTKNAGIAFVKLTPAEQQHIADTLKQLADRAGEAAVAAYSGKALEAAKNNADVRKVAPEPKEGPSGAVRSSEEKLRAVCLRAQKAVASLASQAELIRAINAHRDADEAEPSLTDEIDALARQLAELQARLK